MINSIFEKIKHFLSLKIVTLTILFATISARIIQLIYLFNIRSDRSYQMLATQNLVSNRGISIANVLPGNLSEIIYEPLINWPPGYSLLLAPFYWLFNHQYIIAGITLDIVFSIFMIYITRSILKSLNIPVYHINIYTLFTGFIIYSFYTKTSSDAIAITFFLFSVNMAIQLVKKNKSLSYKLAGLIISLLMCAITKYLYMPIVFIIPLIFIIKGAADNNAAIKKAGIISLIALIITIGIVLIYQKTITGSAVYITQPKRGFFIQNLYSLYPVVSASLINPETAGLLVGQDFYPGTYIYHVYQLIHLIITFLILLFIFRSFYRKKRRTLHPLSTFYLLTFFITSAILFTLILLSVLIEKEDGYWTYVQEARYYGLPIILLQLLVFIMTKYLSRYFKIIFPFALLLMLPDMLRGISFATKRISNFNKEKTSWQVELSLQQYADTIIKREQNVNEIYTTVLAGSSSYINNRICLFSHIPMIKDVIEINKFSSLNTKKPVLLLVVLRDDALKDYKPFLSLNEKKYAGKFAGFHFYTTYVNPH